MRYIFLENVLVRLSLSIEKKNIDGNQSIADTTRQTKMKKKPDTIKTLAESLFLFKLSLEVIGSSVRKTKMFKRKRGKICRYEISWLFLTAKALLFQKGYNFGWSVQKRGFNDF